MVSRLTLQHLFDLNGYLHRVSDWCDQTGLKPQYDNGEKSLGEMVFKFKSQNTKRRNVTFT